ncbi:MAG: glycosyltransferase family 2 protein, partial [Elusimicrobiaceae bacterium]|nr:glycosyltransferase family 2 protein [Elusimicrobiaceae bacterium]
MSPTPLISVIISVYNTEKYLCKCVDSVLTQTYQNLEVILVDDGSTDSCGRICDEYVSKDSRVQVIHQQNAGLSAVRNAGIKAAKGEYFSFIDSDDWVDARFIETLWNLAEEHRAPVCVVGRYTVFPTQTRREKMLSNGKNIEIIE